MQWYNGWCNSWSNGWSDGWCNSLCDDWCNRWCNAWGSPSVRNVRTQKSNPHRTQPGSPDRGYLHVLVNSTVSLNCDTSFQASVNPCGNRVCRYRVANSSLVCAVLYHVANSSLLPCLALPCFGVAGSSPAEISDSISVVSGRIGGLSEEVTRLLGTVRSNYGELESHVETSKAFAQATTAHQVVMGVCKAKQPKRNLVEECT